MDMARQGHEIDDLNPFEKRRLENEQLLFNYLKNYEPIWAKEKVPELANAGLD